MESWSHWHEVLSAHPAYCNRSQHIFQYKDHSQIFVGKPDSYRKNRRYINHFVPKHIAYGFFFFFFDKIYPEIPVLSVLLKLDLYTYLMGMVRQSNSVTSGGAAIRVVTRG